MLNADLVHTQPGLITLWDFRSSDPLTSQGAVSYTLQPVNAGTFTADGLYLERGQWYRLPRAQLGALDVHGPHAQVSVVAWLKRMPQPPTQDCETLAGVWDESRKMRQYCLFLDLPIWGSKDQVGGHVSSHGGPTPGHPYCMDAAIGATVITYDAWHTVGFSYDGEYARAYLDGQLDARNGRNPFHYPHGLHNGGPGGADFTVGAVSRSGEPGNFFHGMLAGIAVYSRALDDSEWAQLAALHHTGGTNT
jgi:hypothetical protein